MIYKQIRHFDSCLQGRQNSLILHIRHSTDFMTVTISAYDSRET
jgi:hypothetical protein